MNFFQHMLIFYFAIVLIIIYFMSGIKLPFSKLLNKMGFLGRITQKKRREKKVSLRLRQMIVPSTPKSFSEIMLISILYLFIGFLILSKIFFFAVVVSDSMVPTFAKGDLVLVQTISKTPEVGNIILFSGIHLNDQEQREFIIHRVYRINKDGTIKTKGDAMPVPDPWVVEPGRIVGKAVMLFGHPIVIKYIGSGLILEPGKPITNPLVIQYIMGETKRMGLYIFVVVTLLYIVMELRESRIKKVSRYRR